MTDNNLKRIEHHRQRRGIYSRKRTITGPQPFKEIAIDYLRLHGPISCKEICMALARCRGCGSPKELGSVFNKDPRAKVMQKHHNGNPNIWIYEGEL